MLNNTNFKMEQQKFGNISYKSHKMMQFGCPHKEKNRQSFRLPGFFIFVLLNKSLNIGTTTLDFVVLPTLDWH